MTFIVREQVLKAVRSDPKIGRGTCSMWDEAYTDDEVIVAYDEFADRHPRMSRERLIVNFIKDCIKFEKLYWEVDRERRIGYGCEDPRYNW